MTPVLFRAAARYHLRHPWQLALAAAGIALGVAVVVAVDIAAGSARRAFELSAEAVSGRATHEITGGPAGLPDSLYARLRTRLGIDSIAPVIDRWVRLPAHDDATLRLLGVDPFAERPFRAYVAPATGQLDFGALLARRALLLSHPTADRLALAAGDTLDVMTASTPAKAIVAGVLQPADALAAEALADIALADIATAQELTGTVGVIDRIDVRASADRAGAARLARIRNALPPGVRLTETAARTAATARLSRAFETNLTALALVALVFGLFLIYNSMTFAVVQRRPLIGLLRAQGVTAQQIFALILGEALLLGFVATAAGLVIGVVLGSELVRLVTRTINDLYFVVTVTSVRPSIASLAKGSLLGVCATVLAALPPAREAARARPRAALVRASLERAARRSARRGLLAGSATAIAAAVLIATSGRSLPLGFAALFVIILAAALLTPAAMLAFGHAVAPVAARLGAVARLAARGVDASLSRTAPAIAALAVSLAVGIAASVMIDSFRAGVSRWLDQSLQADIYISAPGLGRDRTDAALDAALARDVAALAGVAGVSTYRHASVFIRGDITRLVAVALDGRHRAAFELLDGDPRRVWPDFARGGLLVSEPFAYRHDVGAGDSVVLPTDRGDRPFPIAAVYRDYASEHGVIYIDRTVYDAWWNDAVVNSVAVFLTTPATSGTALEEIRALDSARGASVRANRSLRASTLEVFDRTFVITGVLRILALIVAFIGVTGALMALQLERVREIGVLRATGLTPVQVWALVIGQTGLMGAAAAAIAMPLGIALAWGMVHIINERAFGWTFDMQFGALPFAQALAVGITAALLAGMYPAWRMARLRPAEALREE